MTRVFAYLRVSTLEQLDKGGHERQLQAVVKFCDSKQWAILRAFNDQQSGGDKFEDRRKLQECLDLCGNATGVSIIVVERADRIARDMIEQEIFFRECAKRKILVYAVDSGEEMVEADADPTRKMMRRIIGALAEWEKDQTARKLLAGRRRKALLTGKPCGGPAPYNNRPVIEEALSMRDAGCSYRDIASRFNTKHVPTPGGTAYWFPATVQRIVERELTEEESKRISDEAEYQAKQKEL